MTLGRVAAPSESAVGAIDPHRAYCGVNATYFDEKWRWMAWRQTRRSWNSTAAITGGLWLAYRKLYGFAVLHGLLWVGAVALAARANWRPAPVLALALALAASHYAAGVYGNSVMERRFRRVDHRARRRAASALERERILARDGGVNLAAAALWLLSVAAGVALAVGLSPEVAPISGLWPEVSALLGL